MTKDVDEHQMQIGKLTGELGRLQSENEQFKAEATRMVDEI